MRLLLLCLTAIAAVYADEMSGCGGFLELSESLLQFQQANSLPSVDFSSFSVEIRTPDGTLKDTTECAPNGYYFLPVYDSGSFVVSVVGKEGWIVRNHDAQVSIDSPGAACNGGKDINFEFTGFKLHGEVTSDVSECQECSGGLSGVQVDLLQGRDSIPHQTTTSENGKFEFVVGPGSYTLKASHPSWSIQTTEIPVTVSLGPVALEHGFEVTGFPVMGRVLADGEAIVGVDLYLLSKSRQSIVTCNSPTAPADFSASGNVVCKATSDEFGSFVFPSVPSGEYTLQPHYRSAATQFDVQPGELGVSVKQDTRDLGEAFTVAGFAVTGRVVTPTGQGVAGAEILLNGKVAAVADTDGGFLLDSMSAGSYTIEVKKQHLFFEPLVDYRVVPSSPVLPDIPVAKYHLCGVITIRQVPTDLPLLKHRDVVLTGSRTPERRTTNAQGEYCFEAAPGTYYVTPTTTPEERAAGLLLQPQALSVVITDQPKLDANFEQRLLSVSGQLQCLDSQCLPGMEVELAKVGSVGMYAKTTASSEGVFEFDNVLPGMYRISPDDKLGCWAEGELKVEVGEQALQGLSVQQNGYRLHFESTHATDIQAVLNANISTVLSIPAGASSHCLGHAGKWTLSPQSCFRFQKTAFIFDSHKDSNKISLDAQAYRVSGLVRASHSTPDLAVEVTSNAGVHAAELSQSAPGLWTWEVWARQGTIEVTPKSSGDVLFYPQSRSVEVGPTEECLPAVPEFLGRSGLVLEGSVSPPVEGVAIVVKKLDGEEVATAVTDRNGVYNIGNLYDDAQYKITASLDGYDIAEIEGTQGHFTATKLSKVTAIVRDASGNPVEGVLLSLSGRGYRKNSPTSAEGVVEFPELVPAEYFLKPFMKEYSFEPLSHQVPTHTEGAFEFVATRTAFSAFGRVRDVGGSGLKGAVVEAVPHESGVPVEESQTDRAGKYRIRGLQPGTTYALRIKESSERGAMDQASPATRSVVVAHEDSKENDFIVIPQRAGADLTGLVEISDDALVELVTINIALEGNTTPIMSRKADLSKFFTFPRLAPGSYSVSLSSSLDTNVYKPFSTSQTVKIGTEHKHVVLKFEPSKKVEELDDISSAMSFLSLTVICLAMYAVLNRETVAGHIAAFRDRRSENPDAENESFVTNTVSRRKPKAKKQ